MSKDLTIPASMVPAAGQAVTTSGMEMTIANSAEVAASAAQAAAVAEINAMYELAMRRPRSIEHFRQELLRECKRPGLAEMAQYSRPVGREKLANGQWVDKVATGPTIHLMRTAHRLFCNLVHQQRIVSDTAEHRVVRESVIDCETNVHLSYDFMIDKRIERKADANGNPPKDGADWIGTRMNSKGEKLFIRRMNLDEVRKEQARMGALTKRRALEEAIPRDIIQEALDVARATNNGEYAKDPEGRKRKMIDKFWEGFSVTPEMISDFLGQSVDKPINVNHMNELIGVFQALKDGDTWEDIMAPKNPAGSADAAKETAAEKLAGGGKPKDAPKPDADGQVEKLVAAFAWLEYDIKTQMLKSLKVSDIKDCPAELIEDTLGMIELQMKKAKEKKK